jgi:thiol-disulfide isomerase/thioredoxin
MMAHQRKLARSVVLAADKALTLKPTDQQAMQAWFFKLQALGLLSELNEPGAEKSFAEAITAARDDKRPDIQAVGMKFFVERGFSQWPLWNVEEKKTLLSEVVKFLSQGKPTVSQMRTLLTVMQFLEAMQDEDLAKPMLNEIIPHFQESDNESLLEVVKKLEGTVRRLNLPGHQMQLNGTLLDGNDFDWKSYRGKVVLVDFWATWCQPCRQEVPNVLELHKAYHEKGFEVVGVSLDDQREQAESYIEQYDIPWPNIFSENEDERGWDQPMAVYYGITGIPRAILVDRDGKVVHLQARGETLARELRRLLGEPIARADTVQDKLVKQVDASAPTQ